MLREIETVVKDSFKFGLDEESVCEAMFKIVWQLQECVEEELDGYADLGPVLTVSGDAEHAWATECIEYVKTTWGEMGELFLHELQVALGKPSGMSILIIQVVFLSSGVYYGPFLGLLLLHSNPPPH